MSRPVAVRASFSAASTPSAPVGPQNDLRAPCKVGRQHVEQVFDEAVLHRRSEVECLQRQAVFENLLNSPDHDRVIVSKRQRACTREAIDEHTPVDIFDVDAFCSLQGQGRGRRG